jgi:hypothetical protein
LTGKSAPTDPAALFCNDSLVNIPAAGIANPYPSGIEVAGLTGSVLEVTVDLHGLRHDYYGDIDMLLVGPRGQNVMLMSDTCDTCYRSGVNLTFRDGAQPLPLTTCPVSGDAYRPTNYTFGLGFDNFPPPAPQANTLYGDKLSIFNGTDPNGTWNLFVSDDAGGFAGRIATGWCLSIHTTEASTK